MQSKTLFLLGLCTILSTTASALPLDSKGAKQRLNKQQNKKYFRAKLIWMPWLIMIRMI